MPQVTSQKDLAVLAGGVGALTVALWALWQSPRERAAHAALSQVGLSDSAPYWHDVLPVGYPPSSYPKDWCGGFVLWALHQADLGKEILWQVGTGFLEQLPTTTDPQIGDIAYFTNNQHHAMVTGKNSDGSLSLVNGNGTAGKVSESTITPSQAAAFYSIQGLITPSASLGPALWMIGGVALAGGVAWKVIR